MLNMLLDSPEGVTPLLPDAHNTSILDYKSLRSVSLGCFNFLFFNCFLSRGAFCLAGAPGREVVKGNTGLVIL